MKQRNQKSMLGVPTFADITHYAAWDWIGIDPIALLLPLLLRQA